MKPLNLRGNNLKRTLGLILLLSCLVAGVLTFYRYYLGQPQPQPRVEITSTPKPRVEITSTPSINITRAEYEQALATWRAQDIEEYEVTIYEWASMTIHHSMTFRVANYGKEIFFEGPNWASPGSRAGDEFAQSYTIEAIFAEIESLFGRSASLSHYPSGQGYLTTAYEVKFHPSLGYPTQLVYFPRHVSGTPEFVLGNGGKEVQDLKVLRQSSTAVP